MKKLLTAAAMVAALFACTTNKDAGVSSNPLINPDSNMYMNAPDFASIKVEHFTEGFEKGFEQQNQEIEAIVNNSETPTFDNTILALEKSGEILSRTSSVFFALASADTNDEIRKIEAEYAPKLSAHNDARYLNDKLFVRIKSVYENSDQLDPAQKRLTKIYYDNFVMAGANLEASAKEELKKINEREATLLTQFGNKLTDATNVPVLFESKELLDGLSEDELKEAADLAAEKGQKGKYMIRLVNTTQQPVMVKLNNREARKRVLEASMNRCSLGDANDTHAIITELAELRAKKANLLGFDNYSDWTLQNTLAKNANTAKSFLADLAKLYIPKAQADAKMLQDYARKSQGEEFVLEAWDWDYYAERLRKEEYSVDEDSLMQYFELNSVLNNGVFFSAEKLYGLTFKQRTDIPVYHPDVTVYDIFDKDGSVIALFYFDPYARPSKSGGAWMGEFVQQSHLKNQRPVIYNVCNFKKPVKEGGVCLLSWDEVTTLYHEFGHALHGLLSDQPYPTIAGTNTPRDFVEMPSQFNEHWANEPQVFANYAKHHKTGEPMPQELRNKMLQAQSFNQAYALGENIASCLLDLSWHTLAVGTKVEDFQAFEKEQLSKYGMYNLQIPPRYKVPYFRHIWSNGYASGYYSYLWAEALDNDVFAWFQKNGGMTPENGAVLRKAILSAGNSADLMEAFASITGHTKADINPLLQARGLK